MVNENIQNHDINSYSTEKLKCLGFTEEKEYINVEILDNGTGLQKNKTTNHNSKALDIFEQRKKGIERRYKKGLTFEIQNLGDLDSAKHGVRVFLQIPILNDD